MISVEEALARLLAPLAAVPPEQVSLADAVGRVLAEDVAARRTQPPFAVSAMDGYAVRADDVARRAGHAAHRRRDPGRRRVRRPSRTRRGRPHLHRRAIAGRRRHDRDPGGHRARSGDRVEIREGAPRGRYVRRAGLDFAEGEVLLQRAAPPDAARHRPRRGDEPALAFRASAAASSDPVDRRRDRDAGRPDRAAPDRQLERAGAVAPS